MTEEEQKRADYELVLAVLKGLEQYDEQCRAEWREASFWTKVEWFWNDLPWQGRLVLFLMLPWPFIALAALGAWAVAR